jgi:phosphopentomutase
MKFKRVFLLVLDSVGIGELPDAKDFGDAGSNTLSNTARIRGGLKLPVLQWLGLGNISEIQGVQKVLNPRAYFGKMAEKSKGKDTTVGHWELMGIITEKPFPTFPHGFPEEILSEIKEKTGVEFIGNYPASGTEIIKKLGEEHIRTKKPILYTSADSVFQIAAHVDLVPLERLYSICEVAREILNKYRVARVIARPFTGKPGNFQRTPDRRDYSIPPPQKSILEFILEAGYKVYGIGKIGEIFAFRGFTEVIHTKGNKDTMETIIKMLAQTDAGLIFANLVDFDMLFGHRNDPDGYARALEEFDGWLQGMLKKIDRDDMLIITADHGNDPTTPSTDHSREYVPLLVYSPAFTSPRPLGTRKTFADVGQTIAENFLLRQVTCAGTSFLELLV